jgi:spore coat protein A
MRKFVALGVMLLAVNTFATPLPGGTLDPTSVPKYVEPLAIPPLMPQSGTNAYSVAAKPFVQQVLPAGFPATKVWAYGSTTKNGPIAWPAATIQAQQGVPLTVTWQNRLVDASGHFVPHLLPVDPTLHWANPPGPVDFRPTFTTTPGPYTGPVPLVTHLHGAHVNPDSDGYPEAWFLPNASNVTPCRSPGVPAGCFFTKGSNYGNAPGVTPVAGQATFRYRNDQRASTLWFHDHTLGMTRTNVYAGLAGFYLVRDGYETQTLGLTTQYPYGKYEIPLVIQDRSFNADGSLFYPDSRVFFDGFAGPYIPDPTSDISPIWNAEYFGNFMTVNGKTWPKLTVEPRKYRFRVLNGSDSRWLVLDFANGNLAPIGLKFNIIGTDGGLITGSPVPVDHLRVAPGERYDVIVDFTGKVGQRIILANVGPDSPFGGVEDPTVASDPGTTAQVMAFDVVAAPRGMNNPPLPGTLNPPSDGFDPRPNPIPRTVTITEFDSIIDPDGPSEAQLGNAFGPLPWMDPITENIATGTTERWTIVNRTEDAHPIHLHQTQFKVVSRAPIDLAAYNAAIDGCAQTPPVGTCPPDPDLFVNGPVSGPYDWEKLGHKDTLQTNPGEITKLDAYFDIPGLYVWHCHILSHEDNEMMRPLCVGGGCKP